MVDKSGIDGYELHESGGRRLRETDLDLSLKRNIKRITRLVRRDPGQQKIVGIDCQHYARPPLPSLHVREGKLYGHHFPNPKCCHTPSRPGSRP